MLDAASFANLLTQTFSNQNNEERRKGEQMITDIINSKPNEYVSLTADIIQGPSSGNHTRQLACTAFLDSFKMDLGAPQNVAWAHLDPAVRQKLKDATFPLLIDQSEQVRRLAGSIMALVFVMDITLPHRQFFDILPSICSNIGHENKTYAAVAIHGLAQVCQEMTPARMKLMPQDEQEVLLGGIANAMKIQDENAITTVVSVGKAMPAIALKFENEEFLRFILEQLLNYMSVGVQTGNLPLIHEAVNTLGQVAKFSYYRLGPYYPVVFKSLLELEPIKDKTVRGATCEFFLKCLKYEERKPAKYFNDYWQAILQNCLQRLYDSISFAPEDHDSTLEQLENTNRLMNAINRLYFDQCFPHLGPFVGEKLASEDLKELVVAVMTLESLIDIKSSMVRYSDIAEVFKTMFSKIGATKSGLLKITALNCADRTLILYVDILYQDNTYQPVINDLLGLIGSPDESEVGIQIKLQACHMLETIAEQTRKNPNYLILLQKKVVEIMGALLDVTGKTADTTATEGVFATIFCYLENVLTNDQMNHFFPILYNLMGQLQQQFQGGNKEILLDSVVINMNLVLSRLMMTQSEITLASNDPLNFLGQVLKEIANIYDASNQKTIECVTLMTTIITCKPDFFAGSVLEFFDRYVKMNLSNIDNVSAMEVAVLSFNALIKTFPTLLQQQMNDFAVYVFTILNSDLPKELKLPIYYFLSDIMISRPEVVKKYAAQILEMDRSALELILKIFRTDTWDDQLIDFCVLFRNVLIENLFCYIHGVMALNDQEVIQPFEAQFPVLQEVLKSFLDDTLAIPPPPDYHKTLFAFLTDAMGRLNSKQKVDMATLEYCFNHIDREDEEWEAIRHTFSNIKGFLGN